MILNDKKINNHGLVRPIGSSLINDVNIIYKLLLI